MYFKVYVLLSHFSHVQLFVTACVHRILQVKILEWLSFPPPGNLPNPGIEATSSVAPALQGRFFTTEPPGKSLF